MYSLGLLSGLLPRLGPLRRLALFLAALCHDIEHPVVITTTSTSTTTIINVIIIIIIIIIIIGHMIAAGLRRFSDL